MVHVRFVAPDGQETGLDGMAGETIRDLAIDAGVEGIVGECGGSAMCATCHVYVDGQWASRLPPVQGPEEIMLDNTACERRPTSRLSCQLELTDALDGIVVHLPDSQ